MAKIIISYSYGRDVEYNTPEQIASALLCLLNQYPHRFVDHDEKGAENDR